MCITIIFIIRAFNKLRLHIWSSILTPVQATFGMHKIFWQRHNKYIFIGIFRRDFSYVLKDKHSYCLFLLQKSNL